MAKVNVALGERSYDITIERGLLRNAGAAIASVARGNAVAVVAQRKVWGLWGQSLLEGLQQSGLETSLHLVPSGESAKNLTWVRRLYDSFAESRIDRKGLVVAFGGGAVGDLAGFAAASWLRGVDFVQVPTTLLSQVDASVGGKVGVNLPIGKNLVGAFWQPRAVLIDPDTLKTLPARDLRSGLSEVIKYGVILSREFFDYVSEHRAGLLALEDEPVIEAIRQSCELKAYVVREDEREGGLRAILNYGHTIGHAVEKLGGYGRMRHGEAVAIGMVLAGRLAVRLGIFETGEAERVEAVLRDFGLPTEVPAGMDVEAMISSMALDKKTVGGKLRFIVPRAIGTVETTDAVTPDMVKSVIRESQQDGRV